MANLISLVRLLIVYRVLSVRGFYTLTFPPQYLASFLTRVKVQADLKFLVMEDTHNVFQLVSIHSISF